MRFWPSRTPRRSRMRLMVRTEGSGSILRLLRASWITSAPWNPRSLTCSNSARTVRTRSAMMASVLWGGVGTVVPVDPVESLPLSLLDPVMDHGLTDVELTGGVVLGLPPSDGGDDGPTASGIPVSLLMMTSGRGCGFSVQNTPE